eukprot:TRINITY_DN4843_c1_g1_i1.p1 TRINITY_DN4843_c1_g1~~TRINITY_DN4843_c1_g1_i1.p1  ORF type:complete len:495 (+),score=37.57 TRINITY_DN4843_c1_g1_i1:97-1485(+)
MAKLSREVFVAAVVVLKHALLSHCAVIKKRSVTASTGQWVHWVFVTDCSAYMYNQANLLLASAHHVNQPGEFTWIAYGCSNEDQKRQLSFLAHPRAKVWHVQATPIVHPRTGEVYQDFQASNRPLSILDWWRKAQPKEEAIGILDPDEFWMRPVHFVSDPDASSRSTDGPWMTKAVAPKMAHAAQYGIGCAAKRLNSTTLNPMCGGSLSCMALLNDSKCAESYSSGPPWVLHRSDADDVFGDWVKNVVLMHEAWPDMLAEQGSYGITQAKHGIKSSIDPYWFLSKGSAPGQPWSYVQDVPYDPCRSRRVPEPNLSIPPLWHACSIYKIPDLHGQSFFLHKNAIHKDLLECDAPLLRYPPEDALEQYYVKAAGRMHIHDTLAFQKTWAVCTYTNLVNHHAATYKRTFCSKPNLEATFVCPSHAQGFLLPDGDIQRSFRSGGWGDIDYTIGRKNETVTNTSAAI